MSITNLLSKAGALVLTGAAILGVAYGMAKYVNDFENAKAEIQNLRGQITQLHEVLAKTQSSNDTSRIERLEQQVAELKAAIEKANPAQVSVADRIRSGLFSGTATDGKQVWPFRATNIRLLGNNEFEADVDWQTLNAVHRIKGRYSDDSLFFKEVDFVKKGNNVIGCEYTLETQQTNGLSGTYRNCDGGASGGTIEVRWF